MQSVLVQDLTVRALSISNDDNHYNTGNPYQIFYNIYFIKMFCYMLSTRISIVLLKTK